MAYIFSIKPLPQLQTTYWQITPGAPFTNAPVPLAGDATALARRTKKIADTR